MAAKNYPTPHIKASPEDFGKTVLMPGDPLRSKFIAENFLKDPVLINNVRGVQGYTGTYNGVKVTVMASGMGMPSMGIYSYELFNCFDVDNIIRIGSAGSIQDGVHLRDIVIGMGSSTDSNYAYQYNLPGSFSATASFGILTKAANACEQLGAAYHVGNILSSDLFYCADASVFERWAQMGILAVEMESAALYMNAARSGKNALAICTVSDHITRGERLSTEERQTSFTQMMEVALNTAVALDK